MYVYVIGCTDGPQKIGISHHPRSRLSQLKTGSYHTLELSFSVETEQAALVEGYAHRLLHRWRLSGEWFSVSPEAARETVEQALQMVEAGQPAPPLSREPAPEPFDYESPTPSPAPYGLHIGINGAMKRREINADAYRRLILGRS